MRHLPSPHLVSIRHSIHLLHVQLLSVGGGVKVSRFVDVREHALDDLDVFLRLLQGVELIPLVVLAGGGENHDDREAHNAGEGDEAAEDE